MSSTADPTHKGLLAKIERRIEAGLESLGCLLALSLIGAGCWLAVRLLIFVLLNLLGREQATPHWVREGVIAALYAGGFFTYLAFVGWLSQRTKRLEEFIDCFLPENNGDYEKACAHWRRCYPNLDPPKKNKAITAWILGWNAGRRSDNDDADDGLS